MQKKIIRVNEDQMIKIENKFGKYMKIYKDLDNKIENINVLIQPTESCNLKCKYCFDQDTQNFFKVKKLLNFLKIEEFEEILDLLSNGQKSVFITFHGGEPLLWGYDNFVKQFEIQKKYPNVEITGIQTNQTLLTENFIELFHKNGVTIGLSFDFIGNEVTRGKTKDILKSVKKVKNITNQASGISVITKHNYKYLLEMYKQQYKLGFTNISFNILQTPFSDDLGINIDEQEKSYKKFFKYYILNKTIYERSIEDIINKIDNPNTRGVCQLNGDCVYNWIGIYPNKDVSNCDFYYLEDENRYGNLDNFKSLNEIFESENYKNYVKKQLNRKQKCLESKCPVYSYCKGGCNWKHYLGTGKIEDLNDGYCLFFNFYVKWISEVLLEIIEKKQISLIKDEHIRNKIFNIKNRKEDLINNIHNIEEYINNRFHDYLKILIKKGMKDI